MLFGTDCDLILLIKSKRSHLWLMLCGTCLRLYHQWQHYRLNVCLTKDMALKMLIQQHIHGKMTLTTCVDKERKTFFIFISLFILILCFSGEYSCLKVDLLFKREFSYYLIQIYTPCCMLVIVSWVSFWLDQGAVPARVSLGVTTLLTMATQTSGINASLPPVSYTKAIDVWTGVCLTFVFGALLEFALVNYASRSG